MKPKSIISFLNVLTTSVFYLSALFIILLIALWTWYNVTGFTGLTDIPGTLVHNVVSFGGINGKATDTYVADSTMSYLPIQNQYKLKVSAISALGRYSIFITLLSVGLGLAILRGFMGIFKELKLDRPFSPKIIGLLKRLAILFMVADVLNIIHYFVFGRFMHHLLPALKFSLQIHIGSSFIIGLVIWIIAVIYQRGVELQTEHDLTV